MNPTRRQFLKTSALAASVFTARSWASVPGANSDIRVAVVGTRGRGLPHIAGYKELKGVRVVALCDVDSDVLAKAAAKTESNVATYRDFRDMLQARDIDAVSLATPNHWHALQSIWALQAGKDVYVEKPISHNLWEGRQLVAAAKKSDRVVQAGTQCRSSSGLAEAVDWVRSGQLGKITAVHGLCYKLRGSIGRIASPQTPAATIDYNLWAGPAPLDPLRREKLHYDWHWQWATGNGDLGNQGIHQMDVARWFLGEASLAPSVLTVGGRLGYVDDGETPNTMATIHNYAAAPLIFEVRGLAAVPNGRKGQMDRYRGVSVGVVVHCENGYVAVPSYTEARAFDRQGKELKKWEGASSHFGNFIDVVRSRRLGDLRGPIGEGHVSSGLCHLGNISHRLGTDLAPAALREKIQGDRTLAEAAGRMLEHLAVHQVDFAATPLRLGAALAFDANTERFTGAHAAAANAHLTRDYRAPFVVPQIA
jgi:predicted dehydrogenase